MYMPFMPVKSVFVCDYVSRSQGSFFFLCDWNHGETFSAILHVIDFSAVWAENKAEGALEYAFHLV